MNKIKEDVILYNNDRKIIIKYTGEKSFEEVENEVIKILYGANNGI